MTLTHEDFENMYHDDKGKIPYFEYIVKKDLGILDHPNADKLMSCACEEGHWYGYYTTYQYAQRLVKLLEYTGDFRIINITTLKDEINLFAASPIDITNCIDRHTVKLNKEV